MTCKRCESLELQVRDLRGALEYIGKLCTEDYRSQPDHIMLHRLEVDIPSVCETELRRSQETTIAALVEKGSLPRCADHPTPDQCCPVCVAVKGVLDKVRQKVRQSDGERNDIEPGQLNDIMAADRCKIMMADNRPCNFRTPCALHQSKATCKTCGGNGSFTDFDGDGNPHDQACPDCHGPTGGQNA